MVLLYNYEKVYIIGNSADDNQNIIDLFYDSGADNFLRKPPLFSTL